YVLNLTQFTIGGVAAPGEPLLDIVPADAPLIIDAQVVPTDIEAVAPGMDARVRLSAYSSRVAPQIAAEVTTVGADRVVVERTGEAFFPVELRIKPDELRKFNGKVKLSPGQPADVMITTGERTVLDYLLGPLKDVFSSSMREE
ncbi:MAG: HlyD family secretion protein, partial [Proteobacteria bacterium]|nr:HlyD family secretion protein [Pseudomonadota bacterium]